MAEFTTKSGAEVVITAASFEVAQNLWSAIQSAAADQKISQDFIEQPESLFNLILKIDSSPIFKQALWPCLIRCTRNKQKIDKTTFEDTEVRKEYYEIINRCVDENIRPFAESLFSELSALIGLNQKAPAAESGPKQP
jgi:hypothetical protein